MCCEAAGWLRSGTPSGPASSLERYHQPGSQPYGWHSLSRGRSLCGGRRTHLRPRPSRHADALTEIARVPMPDGHGLPRIARCCSGRSKRTRVKAIGTRRDALASRWRPQIRAAASSPAPARRLAPRGLIAAADAGGGDREGRCEFARRRHRRSCLGLRQGLRPSCACAAHHRRHGAGLRGIVRDGTARATPASYVNEADRRRPAAR